MDNETTARPRRARHAAFAMMAVFSLLTLAVTLWQLRAGNAELWTRGLFFPLFLLLPWVLGRLGFKPGWRLYVVAYPFLMFAYSYGCVWGAFKTDQIMDKVSHFFSGLLFTMLGLCLYALFTRPKQGEAPGRLRAGNFVWASWGLFFSMFVAVVWEVFEFFDFALTGNDSQHTLDTGVFDTMYDLMACLLASLLAAAAFLLWRRTGRFKLLTAWVVEDFCEGNDVLTQ